MAEPFIGEIRLFAFDRIPRAWMPCSGQIMSINQNQALYSILGTVYGGDGRTTFALPDLRGRVALGVGMEPDVSGGLQVTQGQAGGEETHLLKENEMAMHTHQVSASSADASTGDPKNSTWAKTTGPSYGSTSVLKMAPAALASAGGGLAHENRQPYLAVSYCIAIQGIYPSRN